MLAWASRALAVDAYPVPPVMIVDKTGSAKLALGEDEIDMLDLAFGLTETSRLGCQIEMSKANGLRVDSGGYVRSVMTMRAANNAKDAV